MQNNEHTKPIRLVIDWPADKKWVLDIVEGISKIRGISTEELIPELVWRELEGWDGSNELNSCLEQRFKRETSGKRT